MDLNNDPLQCAVSFGWRAVPLHSGSQIYRRLDVAAGVLSVTAKLIPGFGVAVITAAFNDAWPTLFLHYTLAAIDDSDVEVMAVVEYDEPDRVYRGPPTGLETGHLPVRVLIERWESLLEWNYWVSARFHV